MFDKVLFSLNFFRKFVSFVFFFLLLPLLFLLLHALFPLLLPHLFLPYLLPSPGKPKVSNWGPDWAEVTWGVSDRGRGRRRIRRH